MIVNDAMQEQAKALADPSRFQIFSYIMHSDAAVGVAELTTLLGFNHNAIRQHLAILTEAGLVAEFDEVRTTPGRPRKQYSARADALSAFGSVSGSYKRLAGLLLEIAQTGDSPYEVGYRSAMATSPAGPRHGSPDQLEADLFRELQIDGFEPGAAADGSAELGHCPFADLATDDPGIVCEIHRGILDRFLAERSDGITVDLRPRDPHQAGCKVALASEPISS